MLHFLSPLLRSAVLALSAMFWSHGFLAPGMPSVRTVHHTKPPPAPCRAAKLSATASWQDVARTAVGRMIVKNDGQQACALKGRPAIRLITPTGRPLPVTETVWSATTPAVEQGLPPRDRQLGILRPEHFAYVELRWENWCGGPISAPIGLVITLPSGDQVVVAVGGFAHAADGSYHYTVQRPPCLYAASPSRMAVGTFQLVGPLVKDPCLTTGCPFHRGRAVTRSTITTRLFP